MRLIDADTLVGADGLFSKRGCPGNCQYCGLWSSEGCRVILEAPTVDAVEVKRGQWVYDKKTKFWGNPYRCTVCKRANDVRSNYCPDCGARMSHA